MLVDLQDPPELIPQFVRQWEMGYEIVYGIRKQREEGFLIRNIRKAYYRLLSVCTYVDYPPDFGNYQLIYRVVLNAMKKIDDAQPCMCLMTFDCSFGKYEISYTWRARKKTVSKNKIIHMFEQGMNGIISFSNTPLRLALYFGMNLSGLSFLYAFVVLVMVMTGQIFPAGKGIPPVIVALFFV